MKERHENSMEGDENNKKETEVTTMNTEASSSDNGSQVNNEETGNPRSDSNIVDKEERASIDTGSSISNEEEKPLERSELKENKNDLEKNLSEEMTLESLKRKKNETKKERSPGKDALEEENSNDLEKNLSEEMTLESLKRKKNETEKERSPGKDALEEENKNDLEKKFSEEMTLESMKRKKNGTKKERTIPGKDALAVRYVKMRNKRSENEEEKIEETKNREEIDELSKMKEKLLEGVLGVKAERKEGERWVKLSEGQVEDTSEIAKRMDDLEKLAKVEKEDDKSSEASMSSPQTGVDKTKNRRFSGDNVASRLTRTRNLVRKDCLTLAKEIRSRRKEKSAAFKVSLERRVESVEKILEDRVEKMLEETAEKHPWLQPIESWLVDRYKSARSSNSGNLEKIKKSSRSSSSDSELEKISLISEKNKNKEDDEEETDGMDSGEIFIESVKKTEDDTKKTKNESFLHCNSPKDSTKSFLFCNNRKNSGESSGELSKVGESEKIEEGKEEITSVAKIGKIEKSHTNDFLDKIRDGFKERVEDVQRVQRFVDY